MSTKRLNRDLAGNGALTSADYRFLAGEMDITPDSRQQARQRIRDRTRAALYDNGAILDGLDEHDRDLIFAPVHADEGPNLDGAIGDTLQLLYDGLYARYHNDENEGDLPTRNFENLAESAIADALTKREGRPFGVHVDVMIDRIPAREDIDDLAEQPVWVLKVLLDRDEITKEEFVDAVA